MRHARVHKRLLGATLAAALHACMPAPAPEQQPLASDTIGIADAPDQSAIAHAYAARLRLGLGGPYRLVETVLRDERLGKRRLQLAHDLLDSIQHGRFDEISPLVLVDAGVDPTSAIAQLELIQQTMERTPDPRVAEAAVAQAYQQLARDSVIPDRVGARAVRIAALWRDRQLAMADARRLNHEAHRLRIEARELVLSWRRDRRFAVEQPTLVPLTPKQRAQAEGLGLLLRGGVAAALTPVRSELNRTVTPVAPCCRSRTPTCCWHPTRVTALRRARW